MNKLRKPILLRQHAWSPIGCSSYCLTSIYQRIQGNGEQTKTFINDLIEFVNCPQQFLLRNELKSDDRFRILWNYLVFDSKL
jgi:hypothetical protein